MKGSIDAGDNFTGRRARLNSTTTDTNHENVPQNSSFAAAFDVPSRRQCAADGQAIIAEPGAPKDSENSLPLFDL